MVKVDTQRTCFDVVDTINLKFEYFDELIDFQFVYIAIQKRKSR